jgi:hypothetical protein
MLEPSCAGCLHAAHSAVALLESLKCCVVVALQSNFFGPVALTQLLLKYLQAGAPSRILNMSSMAEAYAVFDWDDFGCAFFLPHVADVWGAVVVARA